MKDLTIELTVLKYFIRALKLRGMYAYFTATNPSIIRLRNTQRKVSGDNPFIRCRTLTDVAGVISKLNEHIDSHHRMMVPDGDPRIEQITMCINHLIHFFVEPNVKSMDVFNQIGQSVFEASVRDLWGDDFLVQANSQMNQMEQQAPEQMREMLWELYLKLSSEGKINCTFDEFVEKANHMSGMPPVGMPQMPMDDGGFIGDDPEYYDEGDEEEWDNDDNGYDDGY